MAYRLSILIVFALAVAAGLWLHARWRRASSPAPARHLRPVEGAVFKLTMAALAALGITGFAAGLAGEPMHGYPLMFHTALGGAFFTGLAILAVAWAEDARLEDRDWLPKARRAGASTGGRFTTLDKAAFWLLLALGLTSLLSILLCMTPLAGTPGQHVLYLIHRTSGLLLAAGALAYGVGRR